MDNIAPQFVVRFVRVWLGLLIPTLLTSLVFLGLSYGVEARPLEQQGDNPVPNPGFELPSPASWRNNGSFLWFWSCRWSGGEFHGGNHSIECASNVSSHISQWWSDFFPVSQSQQYDFSGWIKANGASNRALIILTFYSSTSDESQIGSPVNSEQVSGSSDWAQVRGNAVAPMGARYARIYSELDGLGTVWWDDVSLVPVIDKPNLIVAKHGPEVVDPGGILTFTIIYSNLGKKVATGIYLTDTLPVSTSYEATDFPPTAYVSATNTLIWHNLGDLDAGMSRTIIVTTTANSSLLNGLHLQNRVDVVCNGTIPISATAITTVTTHPHLTVVKSGYPNPIELGNTLIYTIAYMNTGTAAAIDIDLTDTLPISVVYQSSSVTPTIFDSGANVLIWRDLDSLGVGANRFVTITTIASNTASRGDSLCNRAQISCMGSDRTESSRYCALVRPVVIGIVPKESFTLTPVPPGQAACYSLSVNVSDTVSHSVALTAESSRGWNATVDPPTMIVAPGNSNRPITSCVDIPLKCSIISGTIDILTVTAKLLESPYDAAMALDTTTVGRMSAIPAVTPTTYVTVNLSTQPKTFAFLHQVTNLNNYPDVFDLGTLSPRSRISPTRQGIDACNQFSAMAYITTAGPMLAASAVFEIKSRFFPEVRTTFDDEVEMPWSTLSPGPNITKTVDTFGIVTFTYIITHEGNIADTIWFSPTSSLGWKVGQISPAFLQPGGLAGRVVSFTVPAARNGTRDVITVIATPDFDHSKAVTITATITVSRHEVFLPIILKDYRGFCNGGFETGDFECWTDNGALRRSVQSETVYTGYYATALGSRNYTCRGGVPVGKGQIDQTFTVPSTCSPVLSFCYRIMTYDHITWTNGITLGDSLDVYVQSNLILRDGYNNYPGPQPGCASLQDLGWKCFNYNLDAYRGRNVQVSFQNWNREDDWYNTWTYLDQVEVKCKSTGQREKQYSTWIVP
jgi:uncharacterized repeat protein (TIGR01451 family)